MSESPTRFVGSAAAKVKNFLKRIEEKKLQPIQIRVKRSYIPEPKSPAPMKYGSPSPQDLLEILHALKGKGFRKLFANVKVNTINNEDKSPALTSPGRSISRQSLASSSSSSEDSRSPSPRKYRKESPRRNRSPARHDKATRRSLSKHRDCSSSRKRSMSPYNKEKDYQRYRDEYQARRSHERSPNRTFTKSKPDSRRSKSVDKHKRSRSPNDHHPGSSRRHRRSRSASPQHSYHKHKEYSHSMRDKEPPLRPGEFRGPAYRPEKDTYKYYSGGTYKEYSATTSKKRSRSRSYEDRHGRKSRSPYKSAEPSTSTSTRHSCRSRSPKSRRSRSPNKRRSRSGRRRSKSGDRNPNYRRPEHPSDVAYVPPHMDYEMYPEAQYWFPEPRFFPRLPLPQHMGMPRVMYRPVLVPFQAFPPRFRPRPPLQYNNRRLPTVDTGLPQPDTTDTTNPPTQEQTPAQVSIEEIQAENKEAPKPVP